MSVAPARLWLAALALVAVVAGIRRGLFAIASAGRYAWWAVADCLARRWSSGAVKWTSGHRI